MSKKTIEGKKEKSLSSSDEGDDPNLEKKEFSKHLLTTQANRDDNSGIIEVYKDNLNQEMKNLISLLNEYNYIGMDTEYPGIVYSVSSITEDFYYKALKKNVDSLKLIQLGITLSNSKGEYPQPYHTWQFNFQFDYLKDASSQCSLRLLMQSGINFNKLKTNGINHSKFFAIFKNSGLVLNPRIHWISFHGSYDFAYLLNNLIGNSLPQNENDFTNILRAFFPNHYDIRILVKEKNNLQGGLNKLAGYLDIMREGKIHQAGSDSSVTINVFWKLIKNGFIYEEELIEKKNILFGILEGKDNEETINYMKINVGYNVNNNINNIVRKYENNLAYIPFGRNFNNNMNMNCFYPNLMMNGLNNSFYNNMMIKNNNILHYC